MNNLDILRKLNAKGVAHFINLFPGAKLTMPEIKDWLLTELSDKSAEEALKCASINGLLEEVH